jgi:hypothetical protein
MARRGHKRMRYDGTTAEYWVVGYTLRVACADHYVIIPIGGHETDADLRDMVADYIDGLL